MRYRKADHGMRVATMGSLRQVTAAGTKNYKKGSKTVTVTVVVN